jgi:chromosome partitioning protein
VLAQAGNSVLVVDVDPQGSLSQGFFGSSTVEQLTARETIASVFDDEQIPISASLLMPTSFKGLSVIRANQTLAPFNIPSPERSGMRQYAVQCLLAEVTEPDFVLIDCPPNLYQCSWNALLASDFVVVPVPPEDFATQGLRTIHQAIDQAAKLRPHLRLLGHLVTRSDPRLIVHRSYEEKLRTWYRDNILATVIPEASAFKVALSCRQPVSFFAPQSKAARTMDQFAGELIDRIRSLGQRRGVV